MEILSELLGSYSGWLVILIGVVMCIAMPLGIAWGINHTKPSPAEIKDRRVHPEQRQGKA